MGLSVIQGKSFWAVEMGGQYLGVRRLANFSEFFWKNDINHALRFDCKEQAQAFMDALRDTLGPHKDELFPTVCQWGPVEHAWIQV